MLIKNTTNANGQSAKVIGIGNMWIMPGEEKNIPDRLVYTDETDDLGRSTGKKMILPAIALQKRLGMLSYKEVAKTEEPDEEVEEKKATAAAKRAATRAANKAAAETAE